MTSLPPHFRVGWANTAGYVPYPGGGEKWGGEYSVLTRFSKTEIQFFFRDEIVFTEKIQDDFFVLKSI